VRGARENLQTRNSHDATRATAMSQKLQPEVTLRGTRLSTRTCCSRAPGAGGVTPPAVRALTREEIVSISRGRAGRGSPIGTANATSGSSKRAAPSAGHALHPKLEHLWRGAYSPARTRTARSRHSGRRSLLEIAFGEGGLYRSRPDARSTTSRAIGSQRLGFTREAVLREYFILTAGASTTSLQPLLPSGKGTMLSAE